MRLRSTASPICLDTVNPTRTAPSSPRQRACNTKAATDARTPLPTARKSLRRFSRSTIKAAPAPRSRTEPLAPMRAPRRENLTAAFGRHARAKSVPALAHQFARLVGSFHGIFSVARQRCTRLLVKHTFLRAGRTLPVKRRRAIGAAYTRALPARQCDARRLAGGGGCIWKNRTYRICDR
jgi:hypothetical protein